MPYDSNSKLPAYVQKLPENKQSQWRSVFNGCLEDGKEEGACFRLANGVVKKEVSDDVWSAISADALAAKEVADDEAVALAAKSYQYVESWDYEQRKISQEEAGYSAVGSTNSRACSNCFFFVSPARCTVVQGEIAPNGLSKQWRAVPTYEPVPVPVVIMDKEAKPQVVLDTKQPGVMTKAEDALRELLGLRPSKRSGNGFTVIKQADGNLRWYARYSNAWEDRDKEIVTSEAHKEYIQWVDSEQGVKPELWLWHTPGTRFGTTDWMDFSDGFAHASGLIDADKHDVVSKLSASGKEWGVSHGFLLAQDGKYITKYRTFEISVLPRERAAAWGTNFNVLGRLEDMAITKDKRDTLVGLLGEDTVAAIESSTKSATDQIAALGVEYKASEEAATDAATKAAATDNEAIVALGAQLGELATTVQQLTGIVHAQNTTIKELKKTDDDKVSDEFLARVAKAFNQNGSTVQRPTESTDNVVQPTSAASKEVATKESSAGATDYLGFMLQEAMFGGNKPQTAVPNGAGVPSTETAVAAQ
jgi:cation transport regulator ChaB